MSDIVRIMPKEPIEAVPTEWANMFGGYDTMYQTKSGVGVFDDDYAEYCDGHDWVEVTEYVWDDSEETLAAINAALPVGFSAHRKGCDDLWIRRSGTLWAAQVSPASLVRIEGDTFSIHPPKDGDA